MRSGYVCQTTTFVTIKRTTICLFDWFGYLCWTGFLQGLHIQFPWMNLRPGFYIESVLVFYYFHFLFVYFKSTHDCAHIWLTIGVYFKRKTLSKTTRLLKSCTIFSVSFWHLHPVGVEGQLYVFRICGFILFQRSVGQSPPDAIVWGHLRLFMPGCVCGLVV